MIDTNNPYSTGREHWEELTQTTPAIPNPGENDTDTIDWYLLGEYDWHYTVATGHFGDNEPEHRQAEATLKRLRAHLPTLTDDQLNAYLNGYRANADAFFRHGL